MRSTKEIVRFLLYLALCVFGVGFVISMFFVNEVPAGMGLCSVVLILDGIILVCMNTDEEKPQEDPKAEEQPQEQPQAQVTAKEPQIDIQYAREHCYESVEMYQAYWDNDLVNAAKNEMSGYLRSEAISITKHLLTRKIDKAMNAIEYAVGLADPIRDAEALHVFMICALRDFYAIREEDPFIYSCCLQICEYDIKNLDNYLNAICFSVKYDYISDDMGRLFLNGPGKLERDTDRVPLLETPTKKAIILEKIGYLDEAIAFCDYAIEHEFQDTGGNSFLARKMRLEKKKQKVEKSYYY
jgi:hypothetical protein